jgi:plasmid stabilization system protein ParE
VKLRFTPQALFELDAILDYIAARSPHGAERVKARLLGLAGFIQGQPHGGRKTSESGLRRIVATPYPYVVFYEVKDDEVVVVGVRHGARDPGSMPGGGGAA